MSSPGGDDDDLDEVTLWAGRLRAWPTAPQADAEGDETVRSARRAVAAGAGDPAGAEVAAVADAAADADADADETVRSPRQATESTVPSLAPDAEGDETVRSPRRATSGGNGRADASPSGGGSDVPSDDDTAAIAPRLRAPSPVADGTPPGAEREAHAPIALHREPYAPRRDAPVRVARNPATPAPPVQDAATVSPRRHRGGARLVVLAAAIVGVVALAAVGVALLLG